MGCFDYTCECQKRKRPTCGHRGGQHQESFVIVEVPLNNGTIVHIKGLYEEYGYVSVDLDKTEYRFYLNEFKDFFEGWMEYTSEKHRSTCFLASRCWTYEEDFDEEYDDEEDEKDIYKRYCSRNDGVDEIVTLTKEIVAKCFRIDKDMKLLTDTDRYEKEIEELEAEIKEKQKRIEELKTLIKGENQ